MAIMDRSALFSDGQPITGSAASTNLIDLGEYQVEGGYHLSDVGVGTPIPLEIAIVEPFDELTSLTISVQTDDNAAFSTPETVFTSPAYTLAQLNAENRYILPDAIPGGTRERYVRLFYTVAGDDPNNGRITAGVSAGRQTA